MRFLSGLLATGLLTGLTLAADGKFTLTGENTKVEFTGTKPEGKHDGGFKKVVGAVTLTGTDPATTRIEVTIDTNSLWSDDPKLTGHLKSPDFFDVKTNPNSKFVSSKVEKDGANYKVTGELTLNGKKKEISFPATITTAGGALKLDSEFKINKGDFGMNYGKGKISDDVTIKVKIDAK
ncbi:MAG TPA: YceI family protein [Fimbriiglobus sp.]|jgi:polyisoprenoid-binding protein YceI|nr:YceI family protein [Fimbriiglobus sp.]